MTRDTRGGYSSHAAGSAPIPAVGAARVDGDRDHRRARRARLRRQPGEPHPHPVGTRALPAALRDPLAARLRATRIPNALVALLILLFLLAALAAAGTFITVALVNQMPQIVESVMAGLDQLERDVDWSALPRDIDSVRDLLSPEPGPR